MVVCLEPGANNLHMVRLMPLPPRHLLLQQNPEWFILLVPAYPGCPGKKAVERLCVYVHVCVFVSVAVIYLHLQLNYDTRGPILLTISNAYTVYTVDFRFFKNL